MPHQLNICHRLYLLAITQLKKLVHLSLFLVRLTLTVIIACFLAILTFVSLQLIEGGSRADAAPPAQFLANQVISVTHTASTTHQMSVFGDGRITNQYLNDNNRNQIDQLGDDISATTIAIMFDQHAATANLVDVGSQNDFYTSTLITLSDPSNLPGYSEDSYAVYTSKVLSYQITQRTLTTDTFYGDWLIMELGIHNTGNIPLTGGKLLYMIDIDVAETNQGDEGNFDLARRLVYQRDENGPGYAMGISLLEGNLRGYGVIGNRYPTSDTDIRNEMIIPTNAILNDNNDVSWLVTDLPALLPNQETKVVFGLCAKTGVNQDQASANLINCFEDLTTISVSKSAIPDNDSIIMGQPITYNVMISNTGVHYIDNIVVTDTIPTFTNLVTYSVSQGNITQQNETIIASIGRLYPVSNPVIVRMVVTPSISAMSGTVVSNQAFIKTDKGVTTTNVVTHKILLPGPNLVISKTNERNIVEPGDRVTYILEISNPSLQEATGITVRDLIPANTTLYRSTDGGTYNNGTRTVTWPPFKLSPGESTSRIVIVDINNPFPVGVNYITNTATVADDGDNGSDPNPNDNVAYDIDYVNAAPNLAVTLSDQLNTTQPGDLLTYNLIISNTGNQEATGVLVTDTLPVHTSFVSASNEGQLTNGRVTWPNFNLVAGTRVIRTVIVSVNTSLPDNIKTITNTATVADDGDNGSDPNPNDNVAYDIDQIINPRPPIYLPVIMKSFAAAPDLIVEKIVPLQNNLKVIIKNIGNTSVTNRFWVDAYINPHTIPDGVSTPDHPQTWRYLSQHGIAWNVTASIAPNGTLELTINDDFYSAIFSNPGPLPAGTKIYAQADSAFINSNPTNYGAVWEIHEIIKTQYNNISGPIILSSVVDLKIEPTSSIDGTLQQDNNYLLEFGRP